MVGSSAARPPCAPHARRVGRGPRACSTRRSTSPHSPQPAPRIWTSILADVVHGGGSRAAARGDAAGGQELAPRPRVPALRRASRAPPPTPRSPSTTSPQARSRRGAAGRPRCDVTSSTRTTRGFALALAGLREADTLGYDTTRAEMGALALGYWTDPGARVPRAGDGGRAEEARELTSAFERIAVGCRFRASLPRTATRGRSSEPSRVSGRRRWSDEELARRAGQVERFLRLVPIEYGRGVKGRPRHARLRDPGGRDVPRRRRVGVPRASSRR